TCSITPMAPGTVIVISSTLTPPSRMASTTFIASSADCARTTGMRPTSAILRSTSCLVIAFPSRRLSPRNPRGAALHHPLHLGQGGHRRVARRRHREGTVGGPALDGPLRALAHQEAVDEPGGERVAAPHAVENLQVLPGRGLVELATVIHDRAPVVDGRAPDR